MAYEDLLKDTSAVAPNDNNKFIVTILDLEVDKVYPVQFRWKYKDGTFGKWSVVKALQTPGEQVPGTPSQLTVVGGAGFMTVTWNGKNSAGADLTNFKQLDIYINGGTFDPLKPADTFFSAGTKTIAAAPGSYSLKSYAISAIGTSSVFSTTASAIVTAIGETIEAPTNPKGFSSKRILAGIEVSWDGTYTSSTFTGFEAINIYAGNSATATAGTYEQVGVLTANNIKNTIVVPLGTYVAYGQAVYIHAAAVNKNSIVGTIQQNVTNVLLGPGKATDADINNGAVVIEKLASDVLTVGNLKAGDINTTSYIRAGTKAATGTDGIVPGGRIEISSASITQPGANVLPGLYIYNSAGNPVLSAPLGGGLTISGNGTFTGDISGASGTLTNALNVGTTYLDTTVSPNATRHKFSVDSSGVVNAASGKIGGWNLDATSLSSSTIKIDSGNPLASPIPIPPTITFGATNGNHIRITPDRIATYNGDTLTGKFNLTTSGTLALSGTITASDFYLGGTGASQYLKGDGSFHLGGTSTYIEGDAANKITINVGGYSNATGGINLSSLVSNFDDTAGDPTLVKARGTGYLTLGRTFFYGGNNYPGTATTWPDAYQGTILAGDIWLSRKA
jgi:hypothetical protein